VLIPDINLLIYAYDETSPFHTPSKKWLSQLLNGQNEVGIPLVCILGFIRLVSNHKIFEQPLTPAAACEITRSWLATPTAALLEPGPRHLQLLEKMLAGSHATSALTTDCHIAALAVEHQGIIHSNDLDFKRFEGLRCVNPLSSESDL